MSNKKCCRFLEAPCTIKNYNYQNTNNFFYDPARLWNRKYDKLFLFQLT